MAVWIPKGDSSARRLGPSVGIMLIVAACSASPAGSATQGSSAAVSPSALATESPASDRLDTTTEEAQEAPAGAIRVDLTGPPPRLVPDALTATAGDVVFFLDNVALGSPHNLAIGTTLHDSIASSRSVPIGHSAVFTVHGLAAGEYIIWCAVENHAVEGMVGTLTVN